MKKTILTVFLTLTAALLAVHVLAASGMIQITVDPSASVTINGSPFSPKDSTKNDLPVFSYNGQIYVPVAQFAQSVGMKSSYDSSTNSISVQSPSDSSIIALYHVKEWLSVVSDSRAKTTETMKSVYKHTDEDLNWAFTYGGIDWVSIAVDAASFYKDCGNRSKVVDFLKEKGFTDEECKKASEILVPIQNNIASSPSTTEQQFALNKAKSYLSILAFSKEGLYDQLKHAKYSDADARYAVDNCGANWNEQALDKAVSYLNISAYSKEGLYKQLKYSKFTDTEARYAVDNCGANWNEQAARKAKSYLDIMSFSKQSLIDQLEYSGFTHDQAVYGAESVGY